MAKQELMPLQTNEFYEPAESFISKFIFIGFNPDAEEDLWFCVLKDFVLLPFLSLIHKRYNQVKILVWQWDMKEVRQNGNFKNRTLELHMYSETKLLDFIHEFGHCVNQVELNNIRIHAIQKHSSLEEPSSPEILYLKKMIMSSYRVKRWIELSKDKNINEICGTYKLKYVQDVKELNYILEPAELFARAYEQYIWTKINQHKPKKHIKDFRILIEKINEQVEERLANLKEYYWSKSDFVRISKAFDKLFKVDF